MMKKIALIAGQGQLPLFIASYAKKADIDCHVIGLTHLADEALTAIQSASFAITQLESIIGYLKEHDISHIILAGKVHREALSKGPIDATSAALLEKTLAVGDDAALKAIFMLLHQEGISIVPTSALLPDHQLPDVFDNDENGSDIDELISHAVRVHAHLGQFDIGQALIMQDSRILSIEGAEGTDAMIERTQPFIDQNRPYRLFLKASKSGQSRLLDPPVIGADTIRLCAKAGINIIAIEAHHCLLALPKDEISALCRSQGIRLISVTMPEQG